MTNKELEKYYKELIYSHVILGEAMVRMEECIEQIEQDINRVCSVYIKQRYGVEIGSRVVFNDRTYEVSNFYWQGFERPKLFGWVLDSKGNKTAFNRPLGTEWQVVSDDCSAS